MPKAKRVGIGSVLRERYRLDSWIGGGGQGDVYRASDLEMETTVAIKVLPDEISREPAAVTRLKREALAAQTLTHPNVVRLYTFDQDTSDGRVAFLVMQLIAGRSLAEVIAEHPLGLDAPEVIAIAAPIAGAIDQAHALRPPLLHRDIKPANILLDEDNRAYLTDFGIAFEVQSSLSQVAPRTDGPTPQAGTPKYMSPQHVEGERPSPSDDIYSFGVTVYEMLAGTPPFAHGDIFQQIKSRMPDEIGSIGAAANRVLQSVMSKRPQGRPPSASEFIASLAAALGVEPPAGAISHGFGARTMIPGASSRTMIPGSMATQIPAASRTLVPKPPPVREAPEGPRDPGTGTGTRRHSSSTEQRAEQGDTGAQLVLAERARRGRDGRPDWATAVYWYQQAANAGDPIALSRLAECLDQGHGVSIDKQYATALLKQAAEGGYAPAQFRFGMRLLDGVGIDPDPPAGVNWLQAAARNESTEAMHALSRCYAEGTGVAIDMQASAMWAARSRGHADSDATTTFGAAGVTASSSQTAIPAAREEEAPNAFADPPQKASWMQRMLGKRK
ncbi:MAG: serine/threonine-protein kinase [Phycisphaerales bacterium]